MIRWYDRQGRPLPDEAHQRDEWMRAWAELRSDDDYVRVAVSDIDDEVTVSTVWLGLDHNFSGQGPPLIFETMIFGGEHEHQCWRWPTEATAIGGHDQIVARLRQVMATPKGRG